MSAKRSLIPPNRPDEIALGLLEESGEGEEGEDGDGQTPIAAAAALPVVLKRVPNSKLVVFEKKWGAKIGFGSP
jgi:hypothetical protein